MARDPADVADLAETVGLKVWPSFIERACCDKKEVFLNGGWRGGKSASAAFIVFVDIVERWLYTPVPRDTDNHPLDTHLIWLVGPDYKQARQEYFYIAQWARRMRLTVVASAALQGPLTMTISRPGMLGVVTIETKEAADPEGLGSVAPVVILACEAGQFSEEAKEWLEGRKAEKNATLIWSGTFHNDDGKPSYAWYADESQKALDSPTPRRQAFRLPTWENLYLFSDCTLGENGILTDPTLAMWCPDNNHGEAHSGLNHPVLRSLADQYKDKPNQWRKRYGGEPVGITDPVYEWSTTRPTFYLRPLPEELKSATFGRTHIWDYTAGGIDPGLIHPAALTVGSTVAYGPRKGQTWVRACIEDKGNTARTMWEIKDFLQKRFRVDKWGGDPNGLQYTREYENIEAMRGSLYQREARVKVVNGVAQDEMLFFDSDDPGVVLLFQQIQRIHRRKDANGQLVYDRRSDDDLVASFEDMMAIIHGTPKLNIPKRWTIPQRRPVRA